MPPRTRPLPTDGSRDHDGHIWGRHLHACLELEREEYTWYQDRSGITPVRFGALVRMVAKTKSPDKPPPGYFFLACAKSVYEALRPHAPPPPAPPPRTTIDWDKEVNKWHR